MSRKLVTLVYERRIGSMMRKAVLAYMADRANDDGSGVWVSKMRIAREIEASRSGVINVIKTLVADGILIDNGIQGNRSTYDYTICVEILKGLPETTEAVRGCPDLDTPPVQNTTPSVHPVDTPCLPGRHEPSFNRPLTTADAELNFEKLKEACGDSALLSKELAKLKASITDWKDGVFLVNSRWAKDKFAESLRKPLKETGLRIELANN